MNVPLKSRFRDIGLICVNIKMAGENKAFILFLALFSPEMVNHKMAYLLFY